MRVLKKFSLGYIVINFVLALLICFSVSPIVRAKGSSGGSGYIGGGAIGGAIMTAPTMVTGSNYGTMGYVGGVSNQAAAYMSHYGNTAGSMYQTGTMMPTNINTGYGYMNQYTAQNTTGSIMNQYQMQNNIQNFMNQNTANASGFAGMNSGNMYQYNIQSNGIPNPYNMQNFMYQNNANTSGFMGIGTGNMYQYNTQPDGITNQYMLQNNMQNFMYQNTDRISSFMNQFGTQNSGDLQNMGLNFMNEYGQTHDIDWMNQNKSLMGNTVQNKFQWNMLVDVNEVVLVED